MATVGFDLSRPESSTSTLSLGTLCARVAVAGWQVDRSAGWWIGGLVDWWVGGSVVRWWGCESSVVSR